MIRNSPPPQKFQAKLKEMLLRFLLARKRLRKAKSELLSRWLLKYTICVKKLKKYLTGGETHLEKERRKSHAKLHPLPDIPIRRVASKLNRKPTNEIERLKRKGDQWTANDLFRFQYSDPEEGTSEERRELCYAWLDRLQAISKKYCYLAWYEAAIYACYYRLGPIITDSEEKRRIWTDVRREYAQIFLMGRRIWRRASHPCRLRVVYDMAMLCVRFGNMTDDSTSILFHETLDDANNFDYRLMDEVQFAKSVDKINLLENHVIDQFYIRRRSSASCRSSFRSKRSIERTPSGKSTTSREAEPPPLPYEQLPLGVDQPQLAVDAQSDIRTDRPRKVISTVDNVALKLSASMEPSSVSTDAMPSPLVDASEDKSEKPLSPSHRFVHFSDQDASDVDVLL